jgi:hypothetical protein
MPLVEIDLLQGRSRAELDTISDAVHEAMVAELDVPQRDRFQIITERSAAYLRFDPNYLDIDRDEGFLLSGSRSPRAGQPRPSRRSTATSPGSWPSRQERAPRTSRWS